MSEMAWQEYAFETVTVDRRGVAIARRRLVARQYREEPAGGVSLEMVRVPAGEFLMGSPDAEGYDDERPLHKVSVASFALGKHLITQAQWQAVMGAAPGCRCIGPLRPVDCVSFDAAQDFCRALSERTGRSYRLPSEAEWEYACRAGTLTPFAFGDTLTTDLANYNGEFTYAAEPPGQNRHETTGAATFPPNAFGLHDMHGNLWEWCADPWHDTYRDAPADGRSWEAGGKREYGVLRGGAWHDTPHVCRSAVRLKQARAGGDDLFGLRVAWS